jgi:putative ABC transport system substrate-binding protein
MLRRRLVGLALLAAPSLVCAQSAAAPARLAYLSPLSADSDKAYLAAFRQGLKEHGYVEGGSVLIEVRYAAGKLDRLPTLANELARSNPRMFVVYGPDAATAAARAMPGVPIVISNTQDPVASGLVPSLARPGGRITGMSDFHAASTTKRLEILKETLPGLTRLAIFWRPGNAPHRAQVDDLQRSAPRVGIALLPLEINQPEDIEPAFAAMRREQAGALLMLGESVLTANMKRIIELSLNSGIPAMYTSPNFAELGGMLSYGANIAELCRRSAGHVDKILKGAKPGDLPIEQPTQFELVVNVKTARAMGIPVPRSILLRADRVIE